MTAVASTHSELPSLNGTAMLSNASTTLANGTRNEKVDLSSDTTQTTKSYLPVSSPTTAFWSRDLDALDAHRSTSDIPSSADVVIIGAGYAGIATAWHLVKDRSPAAPLLSIVILEARTVCGGATGRNGGHLRPDLYGHIPKFIGRAGVEAGAEVAEFGIKHIRAIKRVIEQEGIECDFALHRTVDVWVNEDAAKKAYEAYKMMAAHDLEFMDDVQFTIDPPVAEGISGVKGAKACTTYTAASLWPYKFILGLTKRLLDLENVNLQTKTPVQSVTCNEDGTLNVRTERGTTRAKKVIHATNGYVSGLLPEYNKNIIPCKGICSRIQVPSGERAPLLNNSYIVRDDEKILVYLVSRSDGSIIVGGAPSLYKQNRASWYNNVDDSVLIDMTKDYFDGYMQRMFNGWEDSSAAVDKIWTGVMGYSFDTNPHIGAVPSKPGQYILCGFNGHGMPVIWLTAKAVAEMVGEEKAFEEVDTPRLFKTTQSRIDRAQSTPDDEGDILNVESAKGVLKPA